MRQIIYLACPYTHPDETIRRDRVELASMVAAKLMLDGAVVFSPITHGHAIAEHLPPATAAKHEFWMDQCLPFLAVAKELIILPMLGWRLSRGIADEFEAFRNRGLPTFFIQGHASWKLDKIQNKDLDQYGAGIITV